MVDHVERDKVNQVVDRGKGISAPIEVSGSGRDAGPAPASSSEPAGAPATASGSTPGHGPGHGHGPGGGPAGAPGYELPLLLFGGFRTLIDRLHTRLAAEGHPELRPAHGFAMQAIGGRGATASEIGRHLGVSKQAAGKTVDRLLALGYADRADDPDDARRKLVHLTPRGHEALARSAAIFDELRAEWVAALGADRVRDIETSLRNVVPAETAFRLDATSWLGAP